MTLHRSDDGTAFFPLAVTGADSADGARVVLHDMPEAVQLSRGERQDEHTWVLRLADLQGLRMTLGDGTPVAFDVLVEVATAAGASLARTVAQVRLADRRQAAIEELLSAAAAVPPVGAGTPFRTEVQVAHRTREPARAALPRPPLPEGLSSLGGPIGAPTPPELSRKLWWRMPARAAWSPFANGASGY
jgi:hypothetical protein